MATGDKRISMKKVKVGYRLNPSDEDLVNHHLTRKLRNILEEYCLIPEFDIYKLPPWDLISKFNGKFEHKLLLPIYSCFDNFSGFYILWVLNFLSLLCLPLVQIYLI